IKPRLSDAIYTVESPSELVRDPNLSLQLIATESAAFDFMKSHKSHLVQRDELDLNVLTAKQIDACFRDFTRGAAEIYL
ncbi:MAG TPA: hypothetical protein VM260_20395, partial [Pirellula sp.]|nr:hypothetical protein [Pirellula sp.]